jgi:F-type H+/Na+-transporting ATPase subunit alpha
VTFQNGAIGFVTEVQRSGGARVALIAGAPLPTETAAVTARVAAVRVSRAMLGRAVDALGDPIDGLGPIDHSGEAGGGGASGRLQALLAVDGSGGGRLQALLAVDPPSAVARAPPRATLLSGFKAIDAFSPLLRGRAIAVTGERGVGKSTFALDVAGTLARSAALAARARDAAAESGAAASITVGDENENENVVCIYVAVGVSVAAVRAARRRLAAAGALSRSVIIAAPAGARSGATYLAPFAGTAVGE